MASKVYGPENAWEYAARWMLKTFNISTAPEFHFNCWWLRLVWWRKTLIMTIEGNVYCRQDYITGRLIRHECTHVWQQHKDGWKFYPRYVWQWIRAGFSYTNIEYEQEARAYEKVNANM